MTELSVGGHFESVQVHFDDLDSMGLLHNSRYNLLVERAITAFWLQNGWAPDVAQSAFPDVLYAVRESKVTYHLPISGAGEPVVHFWIERMGRTSAVYAFRLLAPDLDVVHAEGYRVYVNLDPQSMRPVSFSDEMRSAAQMLLLEPVPC